ncbi:thiamine-phosphate kinase [Ancylobacter defluvii]|uniref:Thiamine-monophosphate kinase n=1 Tax=Ancylobacter defluvii TaxID=1282440 RepID=A0A9W6N9D2_9HYPH|nr:thiamine-phosphate kinase [Ancylobacter defluvii]MBS7587688.1 thiamine-phosphate kinase [Ancylobacter defluvii]GLK82498.1 thiamine-monophosphate kinase [Ancylobacter defluvii]
MTGRRGGGSGRAKPSGEGGAPGEAGSSRQEGASGEDKLIARLFGSLATHPGALGLTDDAAFLTPPPGHDLVLTKDALVAGVHFFPDDPPASIARKAMRVNLSDLAAKGARPLGVLLAFAIPPGMDAAALEAFARGIGEDARDYGAPLLGGDTVKTPGPFTVSITALGAVPSGTMVRRSGARPGQAIVVTGSIGDGALGLALRLDPARPGFRGLSPAERAVLADRYLHPRPRLALAEALRAHASAAMDISDGLIGDAAKLLAVSGVAGTIEAGAVPLSAAARAAVAAEPALLETALTGGDDYEILATVPHDRLDALSMVATAAGFGLTVIGATHAIDPAADPAGAGLAVRAPDGSEMALSRRSFSHF